MPSGSWSIAMIRGLARISRTSGFIPGTSVPMISGAASMAHIAKWLRFSASVARLPTSIMSGSFHPSGPECARNGRCLSRIGSMPKLDQLPWLSSQSQQLVMSPVVRHKWPYLLAPQPRLVLAPFADRQHHRPAGSGDRAAHCRIGLARVALRGAGAGRAPVVLDVVDAPRGILPRVLELVALAARPPGARRRPGVGIDAELEPARMEVIAQRFEARGEALRIGLDRAVGIARAVPAVVEVDVDVAGIAQARGNQRVGGAPDQRLVDIAAVVVPGVPPHRRSQREAFGLLRRGGQGERKREQRRQPAQQPVHPRFSPRGAFGSAHIVRIKQPARRRWARGRQLSTRSEELADRLAALGAGRTVHPLRCRRGWWLAASAASGPKTKWSNHARHASRWGSGKSRIADSAWMKAMNGSPRGMSLYQ